MRRMLIIGLLTTVGCIVAGLLAATALAEEKGGPLWLAKGLRFVCKEGANAAKPKFETLLDCIANTPLDPAGAWEYEAITESEDVPVREMQVVDAVATNVGAYKLKAGTLITISCTTVKAPVQLEGGMPAAGHTQIKYSGCSVEGHPLCEVNSPGAAADTIETDASMEVIYLGSKAEAETEKGKLGAIFRPEVGEVFVTLDIGGEECPPFTMGEEKIKGTMIGELSPTNSMQKIGKVIFPATAIKKGYRWIKKGEVAEVTAKLSAFGVIEVTQSGESQVELETGEVFGIRATGE